MLREPPVLDQRHVLQDPAERHRRRRGAEAHPVGIEAVGLPTERGPLELEEADDRGDLVTRERRFGPALLVDVGHLTDPTERRRVATLAPASSSARPVAGRRASTSPAVRLWRG